MEGQQEAERPPVARLARFDADQLRAIERAIAEHLAVDTRYVAADGFSVSPDGDRGMSIEWRGAARIDAETFNAIVATATAGDESGELRWREHLPEPAGVRARPRRFKRRRRPGDDEASASGD